jgi:protocatechuate 3,4-dioxygenase beta subunit
MDSLRPDRPSRRHFLKSGLAPAALILAARAPVLAQGRSLPATPACGEPTPRQTAGPFFKAGSPQRTTLVEPGMTGTRLVVSGRVLSAAWAPIRGARLDFWQADDAGEYDNRGYRLRGHQLTDAEGRYRLETVVPAGYPGRTRHIHVRVQAPGGPVLTTQLYFPEEPLNRRDGIFDPALVLTVDEAAGGGKAGRFDFVVATAGRG